MFVRAKVSLQDPLAYGQRTCWNAGAHAWVGDNKPQVFSSPKQLCLTYLPQMCLVTCRWEVCRQEIHQDVCLPPDGWRWKARRQEVCQDICLPLIKYVGLWVCIYKPLQNTTRCHFLGTPELSWPEPIILASIYLKLTSNWAQNCVSCFSLEILRFSNL